MSDNIEQQNDQNPSSESGGTETPNTQPGVNDSESGNPGEDTSGDSTAGKQTENESSQTTPDTYADFAMPDGITVDSALLSEAEPLFKELGLSQEQAQKLVDFQAKQVQASSQSQVDTHDQLMNEWQEQSRNDKEFGGDKFEENVAIAKLAIKTHGTPELEKFLEQHGVGNHPEVIRFMVNAGKLLKPDTVSGQTTTPTSKGQNTIDLLYPNDRNSNNV